MPSVIELERVALDIAEKVASRHIGDPLLLDQEGHLTEAEASLWDDRLRPNACKFHTHFKVIDND